MPIRPAVRAALVVSGLSVTAGCGGTATLHEEPTTPNTHDSTTNRETPDTVAEPSCDGTVAATTEACCNVQGGMWEAENHACVLIMVGPFVPPAMIG
ncbi:MAG: hypothetical protein J0L92_09005 [Deltaproteobacteria bacterium]|nr:hypothetical protein [Deltaproteobacteria bacterium]